MRSFLDIKKVSLLIIMSLELVSFSQQLPPIANFFNNQLVYNPAAAGSLETEVNLNLLTRLQWTAIKGAPKSVFLWGDYRLKDNKSAFGLNVNSISYGVTSIVGLAGNYSYNLQLNKSTKLAMGLRLGMNMVKVNSLPLDKIWDTSDPFVDPVTASSTIPSIGTGLRLKGKKYYVGLAAPDLLNADKNDIFNNKERGFLQKKKNYIVTSGYKLKLSNAYTLHGNTLLYYMPTHKGRFDINATFEIRDYFWAGATYSTSNYQSLLVGTHVSSTLRVAYAFQFATGKTLPSQFTTHELSLLLNLDVLKK